jgi:dienelactone hydrolase
MARQTLILVLASTTALAAQVTSTDATRAAFIKLIERPRVELAPEVRAVPSDGRPLIEERFTYAADGPPRVPAVLMKSAASAGRRPVVIQLHGTGGRKEQLAPRLAALASRGFIAVAIDARHHGERAGKAQGLSSSYGDAIFNAFTTGEGRPFFYETVWDVMRLIDYLQTRPDVDPSRIGLGGFSKGGIETYLAAAADPRIAAAVSGHGVQSFGWALDHSAWDSRAWTIRDAIEAAARHENAAVNAAFVRRFYDRVAPGLRNDFDAPAMLPLVAPRPLLVINGDSDPRTPAAGVRESAAAAERAYRAAGAPEKFELRMLQGVGHEQTPEYEQGMIGWFVRWLRP